MRIYGKRHEKHILKKLQDVRNHKIANYGRITPKILDGKSDQDLRQFATSWGPFQLMGYHCLDLDIPLSAIAKGDSTVYWGTKWINQKYGEELRAGHNQNAFHLHNTGRPLPKKGAPLTHDPEYIEKGMLYIDYFKSIEKK